MKEDKAAELAELETERQQRESALSEIDGRIKDLRASMREEVLAEIRKQILEFDVRPAELFGELKSVSSPKQKARQAKPTKEKTIRYKNQKGEVWGGARGPKPQWVKDILAAGEDIEKFRVAE